MKQYCLILYKIQKFYLMHSGSFNYVLEIEVFKKGRFSEKVFYTSPLLAPPQCTISEAPKKGKIVTLY